MGCMSSTSYRTSRFCFFRLKSRLTKICLVNVDSDGKKQAAMQNVMECLSSFDDTCDALTHRVVGLAPLLQDVSLACRDRKLCCSCCCSCCFFLLVVVDVVVVASSFFFLIAVVLFLVFCMRVYCASLCLVCACVRACVRGEVVCVARATV